MLRLVGSKALIIRGAGGTVVDNEVIQASFPCPSWPKYPQPKLYTHPPISSHVIRKRHKVLNKGGDTEAITCKWTADKLRINK